jgi:hypothetical protein
MTSEDVAKIVKRLRGIYPASPYRLDEELVITTWRVNQELLRHTTEHLPAMYDRIMKSSKMFPALSEVLAVLRDLEKGKFHPPALVDMSEARATGYGPMLYAGYLQGIEDLNLEAGQKVATIMRHDPAVTIPMDRIYELRANNGHAKVKALSYAQFMERHAPKEWARENGQQVEGTDTPSI